MKTNYRCMRAMEKCAKVKARATPLDDSGSGTHPRLPDCCNMLQQGYYVDRETI